MNNDEELHPAAMRDYALAYSPVILAVLTVQLMSSTYALRYWLAVCAIPDRPKPAVQPQERQSLLWVILLLLKAAGLVTFGVALYYTFRAMGRDSPEVDAVLTAILFPIATSAIRGSFTAYTALPAISVHRNAAGALVNNPIPKYTSKKDPLYADYVFLPESISWCLSTFILEFGVFMFITLVASIGMSSNWGRMFNSLRTCVVAFFGCIFAVVTATFLLLFSGSAGNWTDAQKSPYSFSPSLGRLPVYTLWLAAIACSSLIVSLTSFCLRFDYRIHPEHSATEHFVVSEEPSPLPTLGPGAAVPSRVPSKFSKPYFFTSIVTFVLAATVALAYLPSSGIILDRLAANIFMMVMAVTVFPLQCIAVILMAGLRGDWQILSEYKEEWLRPAKSDINLEEGSGGNFEYVPLADIIEPSSYDD